MDELYTWILLIIKKKNLKGLLTEGFLWIPSLGGPTSIAARQSGSGISWLFPFVVRNLSFAHKWNNNNLHLTIVFPLYFESVCDTRIFRHHTIYSWQSFSLELIPSRGSWNHKNLCCICQYSTVGDKISCHS